MMLETGGSGIIAAPADASVDATVYNKQQQDIGKCCEIITLSLSPWIHNFMHDLPYPGDMLNKLDYLFHCVDQMEAVGLLKQLISHKVNEASFTTDISTLKDLLNKLTFYANKPENPILSVGSSTQATITMLVESPTLISRLLMLDLSQTLSSPFFCPEHHDGRALLLKLKGRHTGGTGALHQNWQTLLTEQRLLRQQFAMKKKEQVPVLQALPTAEPPK
ncbi:hypothetical protein QOT17_021785 [Balamuthia mandrillaris]